MTTLLVDADILIYQSAASHEEAVEVEPGYWTWFVDEKKVKDTIKDKLAYYMDHLGGTEYHLCLSDVTNFRRQLARTYKGKRANLRRPILLKKLRQDFIDDNAMMISNLEADDVMGIMSTSLSDAIIISIDKDMRTIPGKYFKDAETGLQEISEEQADYQHLYQTLIGDQVDGYAGIKGVGPVAAQKILDKGATWENVLSAFLKAGYTEDYALLQARMARILRTSDFNHETKEVKLWTPH
jgi:DNA polymerase-1